MVSLTNENAYILINYVLFVELLLAMAGIKLRIVLKNRWYYFLLMPYICNVIKITIILIDVNF